MAVFTFGNSMLAAQSEVGLLMIERVSSTDGFPAHYIMATAAVLKMTACTCLRGKRALRVETFPGGDLSLLFVVAAEAFSLRYSFGAVVAFVALSVEFGMTARE